MNLTHVQVETPDNSGGNGIFCFAPLAENDKSFSQEPVRKINIVILKDRLFLPLIAPTVEE